MRTSVMRWIAGIAVLSALGLGAGVALAQESDSEPDNPSSEAPTDETAERPRHRLGKPLRGDVSVLDEDGETKQVHFEAGTVSDVTGDGFTVTGEDGESVPIVVDDDTQILPPGTELSELDGEKVRVMATEQDGDAWVADLVHSRCDGRGGPGMGFRHRGPAPEDQEVEGATSSFRRPVPTMPSDGVTAEVL